MTRPASTKTCADKRRVTWAQPDRRAEAAIAASVLAATALVVTGCAGGGTPESTATERRRAENEPVTLTVATSQNEETPNYYCGVELLKERLEAADIGFTVELYPASQLGPDADRFPLVQAGDIDIDLQGASALSSTFEPIGVVDAAYAFDDVDHAFKWIDEGSEDLFTAFHEATGVNIVDGWFFGNRTFTTKDVEVTSPDDLAGVPIRFPNSPQFLANAEALGVDQPGLRRGRGGLLRTAAGHRRRPGEPDRRDPLLRATTRCSTRRSSTTTTSASTGSSSVTRRTRR